MRCYDGLVVGLEPMIRSMLKGSSLREADLLLAQQ